MTNHRSEIVNRHREYKYTSLGRENQILNPNCGLEQIEFDIEYLSNYIIKGEHYKYFFHGVNIDFGVCLGFDKYLGSLWTTAHLSEYSKKHPNHYIRHSQSSLRVFVDVLSYKFLFKNEITKRDFGLPVFLKEIDKKEKPKIHYYEREELVTTDTVRYHDTIVPLKRIT